MLLLLDLRDLTDSVFAPSDWDSWHKAIPPVCVSEFIGLIPTDQWSTSTRLGSVRIVLTASASLNRASSISVAALLLGVVGQKTPDSLADPVAPELALAQPAGPAPLFGGLDVGDPPLPVQAFRLPTSSGEDDRSTPNGSSRDSEQRH